MHAAPAARLPSVSATAVRGALICALLLALPVRAALFDDDEARRRIETTRNRLEQAERSLSARIDALETAVKNQALVDLFRDVEQIKADVARLRGQQEVLSYELEQAQKRQRDLYLDLDSRLRRIETAQAAAAAAPPAGADLAAAAVLPGAASSPSPSMPPGSGPAATAGNPAAPGAAAPGPGAPGPRPAPAGDLASEQRTYDAALDQFKSGNYSAAAAGFEAFVRAYPQSALAASALYWAGNASFALNNFRAAITTERQLLATYPESQKVPDALLIIANSQDKLGDTPASRRTLQEILDRHPKSEAAVKARLRLPGR